MAGLDSTGLTILTQAEVRDEIDESEKTAFGQSVGVSDDDILGRINAIISEREANLWELAEAVNAASDPDTATGAQQDSICAITGTVRLPAAESTVTLTLTGTPTTVVALGSQASVTGTLELFTTLANGTITASAAWAPTTAYVVGNRVTNSGNVYLCTIAGTSAGSGGPVLEIAAETDGTVTWRFLGNGTGDIDVTAESANTGPIVGASGDIITIDTPVSGWDSVMNILDAVLGTNIESDEDLRVRREEELAGPGTAPIDPLRVDLLAVEDVTTVSLFVNNTNVTDADGVPSKSIEALIQGGTNQDIFDQLLASVAAGILTHGTTAGTATDSEGNTHAQEFTRPTVIDIFTDVTLTFDAALYPTDGDDQVEDAIVAIVYATGKDVVASQIKAACFNVDGVLDVSLAEIDTSSSPSSETTIAIALREIADQDTSRINVSSSAATP